MDPAVKNTRKIKPHAICIPFPAQSHIKAMLKLAKLLHSKGFFITFVNTEFVHARIVESTSEADSLPNLPDLRFATIPDGLDDSERNIPSICKSMWTTLLPSFQDLIASINASGDSSGEVPPASCIVSDCYMSFSIDAAQKFGIPIALFLTVSATTFIATKHLKVLKEKGIVPLKDKSYVTNYHLKTEVDWIPGIMKGMQVKDLPVYFHPIDTTDCFFNTMTEAAERGLKASAIIIHTFDALEKNALHTLSSMFSPSPVYSLGPLQVLLDGVVKNSIGGGLNLWKEETECLKWLDSKPPSSVIYVNFGSIVVLTREQLIEFAMGLANTDYPFLWIIRPDLVVGKAAILPPEFAAKTKEQSMIASWCPQEQVLNHAAVGGFLTHCGWNSTIESITAGVPMLCWPFLGDQQTNCKCCCDGWGIGMEIVGGNAVTRNEVEMLVRELMEGERGKKMKEKVVLWKSLADEAAGHGGSSSANLDELVSFLSNCSS